MSLKTTLGTVLFLTPLLFDCSPTLECRDSDCDSTFQQGEFQVEERAIKYLDSLKELMTCLYHHDLTQNDLLTLSDLNSDHRVTLSEVERTLAEQSKKDNLRSNSECFVKKETLIEYLK